MIRLPTQLNTNSPLNRTWVQTNRSDIFGSLVGTFNTDLTTVLGKLRATRTIKTTDTTTNASLTTAPAAFKAFDTLIWTISGTSVHSSTGKANSPFGADASGSTPTNIDVTMSDLEVFNGYLYVTGGSSTTVKKKISNGSGTAAWTNPFNMANSGQPHLMCVYGSRLYITDLGYNIVSASTGDALAVIGAQFTLSLSTNADDVITFLRPSSNRIWVGVVNTGNKKGTIYEWDGSASNFTRAYRMESFGALSCVIKDDVPYVMDANGKLLVYSSGTFKEVARLPLKNTKYLGNVTASTNTRYIHPNGMTIVDGRINMLINNVIQDNGATIPEFLPSGIWEYDEAIGLYHKYSLSYTPVGTNTITDYGQNRISVAGALSDMKVPDTSAAANGTLLAGAVVYTDATNTTAAVFINDTLEAITGSNQCTQRSGYIVTTKFSSEQVQDNWRKIFIKHKQFVDSSDKVVLKYRVTEADPTEISITWVSTTSCTTTTNVLGLEGYEFEVLRGTGGGRTAHISTIDVASGVYTINLDETFSGVTTGTAKARLQNWTKVLTTATDQTLQSHEFPVGKANEWIQFKIAFIFKERDEIEEVVVINATQNNAA